MTRSHIAACASCRFTTAAGVSSKTGTRTMASRRICKFTPEKLSNFYVSLEQRLFGVTGAEPIAGII